MKKILSRDMLKITAIISMTIDHIGYILLYPAFLNACVVNGIDMLGDMMPPEAKIIYNLYILTRIIGRIAFPIFAFLIAEGALHTSNIKKYFLRLFIFALISEIPYDLAMSGYILNMEIQNIFFTLTAGLSIIILIKNTDQLNKAKLFSLALILFILSLLLKLSIGGILLILSFYLFKDDRKRLTAGIVISTLLLSLGFSCLQWFSILALPIIYLYNDKKGNINKFLFYIYYPIHLIILYII